MIIRIDYIPLTAVNVWRYGKKYKRDLDFLNMLLFKQ